MSSIFLPGSLHTTHLGSRGSLNSRNFMLSASYCMSRPTSDLPMPRISLTASVACKTPMTPGSTPSTPASLHDGAIPAGTAAAPRETHPLRRADPAPAEMEPLGLHEVGLSGLANLRQHQVPRVARLLILREDERLGRRQIAPLPRAVSARHRRH